MNFDWTISVGDILTVLSFAAGIVTYVWGQNREKRQNTLEAYRQLESTLVEVESRMPREYREIAQNSEKTEYRERYNEARAMAAEVEHFCVGINKNIYDKDTAFELGGVFLNRTIKSRLEPIIEKANQKSGIDHYSNFHKVMDELDLLEKKERKKGSREHP